LLGKVGHGFVGGGKAGFCGVDPGTDQVIHRRNAESGSIEGVEPEGLR
jgi:hypothetical protein